MADFEFDEHFSLLKNDFEMKDVEKSENYEGDDEDENELYYEVYFDRTEESKNEDSSYKVEELDGYNNNVNEILKNKDTSVDSEDEKSQNTFKISSKQTSKISDMLESAGMSIDELKKILEEDNISHSDSSDYDSEKNDEDEETISDSDDDNIHINLQNNFADDNLHDFIKDMPDSPKHWRTDDLSNIESTHFKCRNCQQRGHSSIACTKNKKQTKCGICAQEGHLIKKCPYGMCFRCHKSGHEVKQCREKSTSHLRCIRCHHTHHLVQNCPDTWRQYHQTTTPWEVTIVDVEDGDVCCCNCGASGHHAYHCKEKRMSSFYKISSPYIYKYDASNNTPNKSISAYLDNDSVTNINKSNNNTNRSNLKKSKNIQYKNAIFNDSDEIFDNKFKMSKKKMHVKYDDDDEEEMVIKKKRKSFNKKITININKNNNSFSTNNYNNSISNKSNSFDNYNKKNISKNNSINNKNNSFNNKNNSFNNKNNSFNNKNNNNNSSISNLKNSNINSNNNNRSPLPFNDVGERSGRRFNNKNNPFSSSSSSSGKKKNKLNNNHNFHGRIVTPKSSSNDVDYRSKSGSQRSATFGMSHRGFKNNTILHVDRADSNVARKLLKAYKNERKTTWPPADDSFPRNTHPFNNQKTERSYKTPFFRPNAKTDRKR